MSPRDAVMGNYARYDVEFVRGEGTRLWDAEGREYLDFLGGISVCNVGHCHPAVVAAIADQAARLIHVSNLFWTDPMTRLAERLAAGSIGGRVYFANSGAEANEAALKLARKARPRGSFVVAQGGFHGRTYGALSATPQESKQAPFAPLVPGFRPAAWASIPAAVDAGTAGVVIEPIQGESGVHPVPPALLTEIRAACDEHGALLIFDEVQTGMGRTGTLWAYEQTGVVPDLMTVAKALGGGLPIGALIASPAYAEVLAPGDHGSTFAGGPVACAAAHAVLDLVEAPGFLDHVLEMGELLAEGLRELPGVNEVRGRGLMVAAEVAGPAPALVREALAGEALVVNATGPSTIRMLPPLTVSPEEIHEALARLGRVLDA
jgi:acetylornithine/N-succinyldiaminopimelate aminotransferase